MTTLILALSLASLALGLVLAIVGWRGRRLDEHPHCRRCGYDLQGHHDPAACPECGRDLAKRRALRKGTRRKRPVLLVLASLLLLLSVGGAGALAWQRATATDWNTLKPVVWLHADARRVDNPAVADPALNELIDRLLRGELSRREVRALADTALELQQGERLLWPNHWGVILEQGISQGMVTPEQRDAYLRTATITNSGKLTLRPKVRQGTPVPVRVTLGTERVGVYIPNHMRVWMRHNELVEFRIDGEPVAASEVFPMTHHMTGNPEEIWSDCTLDFDGEPGRHTVELDVRCYAAEFQMGEGRIDFSEETRERWFGPWSMRLKGEFDIVPAEEAVVELVPAAQAGPAPLAHARTKLGRFELRAGGHNVVSFLKTGAVWIEEYPLGLSFDIIARAGERDELVGSFAAEPSGYALGRFERPLREFFPNDDIVDIILRTNIAHAEARVDIDSVWDGEIVIENVPTVLRQADPPPDVAAARGAPPKANVMTAQGNYDVRAGNGIWSQFSRYGAIWLDDYPMPVSFDVIGRASDREQVVGHIVADVGKPAFCEFDEPLTSNFPQAERIDLILRTNIKRGVVHGLPAERIWRGEVVMEDVRIRSGSGEIGGG
jgi:hypothetical protein